MSGRASRREAERLILAGRVRVNGETVMALGRKVEEGDVVEVDGEVVRPSALRWIAFHKPPGVLTTRGDPHGGMTVYDVLPEEMAELRYVGRLDKPTEGLLLLSNEGELANGLMHPSRAVEREYLATVRGAPSPESLERLVSGVELEDGPARAARARLAETEAGRATVALVLTEGRKREVRRMMSAIGFPVVRLVRVRFGPIELGDLPKGSWRPLSDKEISSLRDTARATHPKGGNDGSEG
jgi:23S rRNA pseudouridine2605 synthase